MEYLTYYNKISVIDDYGKELAKLTFPETSHGHYEIRKTFVDESLRGKGVAGKMLRFACNEINIRGGEITATCSYAKKYIEENGIRPIVICHMVTSIDGKVTGDFLTSEAGLKAADEYYRLNRELKGDAFACGRTTMESSFTNGFKPDLTPYSNSEISYEDHVAMKHNYYAVSFDRHGNVGWSDSKIHDEDEGYDDAHIIEVLTKEVSSSYLAYLQHIGVSYIFAGETDIDIKLALRKLYELFGIKKLILEGGSIINGAFARAGVIDNLSLVVAPTTANPTDKPLFYDCEIMPFRLVNAEALNNGTVLMEYCWSE